MKRPILTLALGRPTFDVPFAEEMASKAFATLDAAGLPVHGPRHLLFDATAAREAIANVNSETVGAILLLQVTFTDASMTVEIARHFPGLPLVIWAFPEPRLGGRLRLNAFCGLNLAAHALGRAEIAHRTLYAHPEELGVARKLSDSLAGGAAPTVPKRRFAHAAGGGAGVALDRALSGKRIGLVGEHPVGFDTCRYDADQLRSLAGVAVEPILLSTLFERARATDSTLTARRLAEARGTYAGLDDVDRGQLEKSLNLYDSLSGLKHDHSLDAFAVRCWPETFTEYGCAICGPMGMMGESGTPCACEADVLGALSTLLLEAAAGQPGWLVDIVDMDENEQTAVFWHCGSAPLSMRDPAVPARAQIHSNRKMPLLAEFSLKPGPITIARLTQAENALALALGLGEVISAPMPFTGTSATVRFASPITEVRDNLLHAKLEHHVAIAYGDHRAALDDWAALKGLPVLDLTP